MYDCTQRKLNSLLISCIYKLNNLGTVALKKLQYLSSLQVIAEFDLRKTPYKKWTKQKRKMQKNGQNNWEKCMKIVLIDGSENKLKKRIGQISSWKYNISSGFYHPFSWGKWNCQLWPIVSFGTKKICSELLLEVAGKDIFYEHHNSVLLDPCWCDSKQKRSKHLKLSVRDIIRSATMDGWERLLFRSPSPYFVKNASFLIKSCIEPSLPWMRGENGHILSKFLCLEALFRWI